MALLAISGCGGREAPAPRPAPPVAGSPSIEGARIAPARFMELSASGTLFAIRAAELALERSANQALRSAAQKILVDQRGISGQLSFSGRRIDLLPSVSLSAEHQAMLDQLAAAADFDSTWKRQQSAVLGALLRLHRAYAARGASPTLRQLSEVSAPVLARDLAAVEAL